MTAAKPPKVPNPPRRSPLHPAVSDHAVGKLPPGGENPTAQSDSKGLAGKMVRITVDLSHEDYAALIQWLSSASVAVDPAMPRRIGIAQGMRAMLRAATRDDVVSGVVLDQLRRNTSR